MDDWKGAGALAGTTASLSQTLMSMTSTLSAPHPYYDAFSYVDSKRLV
jgi:hypothetical protein